MTGNTRVPSLAAVVLTMGDRPQQLQRAIDSIRRQRSAACHLVLVANGESAQVPETTAVDQLIRLPRNIGIPAARNRAAAATDADLILFLDDDADLLDPCILEFARERFSADPRLAVIALRIVDEEGRTMRRHVPRIGVRSAEVSGHVTSYLGGACIVRAKAFRSVHGYDPDYFYAMEETDLAWRLIDAGWSIWYAADRLVHHPAAHPSRHPRRSYLTARNRLWTAWRSLPWPFLVSYLCSWTIISLLRREAPRSLLRGYREGWRNRPARSPMRWRTVRRMILLGRPPVV